MFRLNHMRNMYDAADFTRAAHNGFCIIISLLSFYDRYSKLYRLF